METKLYGIVVVVYVINTQIQLVNNGETRSDFDDYKEECEGFHHHRRSFLPMTKIISTHIHYFIIFLNRG